MRALFTSNNLIGDSLYLGPALRAWIKKQGCDFTDAIYMQTLPDHVAPLYAGMVRDLINLKTVFERPSGEFKFEHVFDVSKAFALSDQKKQHLAQSYADLLGVELPATKEALKPIYIPEPELLMPAAWWSDAVLISMFSASCTSRDPNIRIPNKMLPVHKWVPLIRLLRERWPNSPLRFLGAPTDRMPELEIAEVEYMTGIPLNRLALIMKQAKLLVTIDNGVSHLGASQETPTLLFYPRCLGLHYILPIGNPHLVYVHMDPNTVSSAQLRYVLGKVMDKLETK